MKRTRNMQKLPSVATRASQRYKENNEEPKITEIQNLESGNTEIPAEVILQIKSKEKEGKLNRNGTRTSKRIAALTSSEDPKKVTIENSAKKHPVNVPKKNKRELEDILAEKVINSDFSQASNSEVEIFPRRGTRIRSSQRIASQVDKKNVENRVISKKAILKLPQKIQLKKSKESNDSESLSHLESTDSVSSIDSTSSKEIMMSDTTTDEPSPSFYCDIDFTQLTTFDLLKSTSVLTQSLMYLKDFKFKNSANEAVDKILMPPPTPKPKRVVPKTADKKLEKMKAFMDSISSPWNDTLDLADLELGTEIKNGSYPLVEELMSRSTPNKYSVSDCNEGVIKRKSCLSNFFPGYDQKYDDYMKHSGIIKQLSNPELETHFSSISHELKDIFDGRTNSIRNNLFLRGQAVDKKELKELNVSIPFTSQQGMFLIAGLYELLIPNMEDRFKYSSYISSVMLPETYIRLYSRINDLSHKKAELEMRFGACYDETKV